MLKAKTKNKGVKKIGKGVDLYFSSGKTERVRIEKLTNSKSWTVLAVGSPSNP